jgi:pyridoxal phosphate enzyme (YggS family)
VLDPISLQARLGGVRERVARAAGRAGREPSSIRLVAVSKTFSVDYVRAACEAGQLDFGENRVQEALAKVSGTTDLGLHWHLIGHLQSNKVRKAVSIFDAIHSIDSPSLLQSVDAAAAATGRTPEVLVQVDLASEPTKHGAKRDEVASILKVAETCRAVKVRGLMLLPPFAEDPEEVRPYFAALRSLRDGFLAEGLAPTMLSELSMGMSHDFEIAIEEGATLVRVGSAIFGSRKTE